MYVCGATPQAHPHIGHLRSAIAFDVLRRWLMRLGLEVTYIRNVTDIDDKILAKSAAAGQPWWAHAYTNELAFGRAYDQLNVLRPTYEPRATGHITDQIELVERLIAAEHAYGALTRQRLDDLEVAEAPEIAEDGATGEEVTRKRDPRDFALWKAAKPGE